jgi:ketosteroid isomerase-like protein
MESFTMKKCPQCGKLYSPEFSFCQDDGTDLVADEASQNDAPAQAGSSATTAMVPVATADSAIVSLPAEVDARPNRSLNVAALVAAAILLLGAGMFILGNQRGPGASNHPQIANSEATQATNLGQSSPQVSVTDGTSSITSKPAEPTPKPSPTPNAERVGILNTVDTWRSAWERQDVSAYMSNYAPDAQIFSNKKWYSYSEYEEHERDLFSYGGRIRVTRGSTRINVEGDTATVSFPFTFQRWGGKGNYRSKGRQKFKLRKNDSGQWVIYEDIFSKR